MGSRLRENPSRFMECWCEIVAPQGSDNPPWIIQKFPRTYNEEVLKSIPQFTFPCPFEKSSVQHFSFVLTNSESKFLYGFCRHAPDIDTALVILSHLPWHELFYKMLNHCSNLIQAKNSGDLWSFLQSFYQSSVPAPGSQLSISYDENKFFIADCPNHISLPSIPENRNLSEYFSAVHVTNMMIVFASMLNERRIVVTSERVSRLSACVQAANSLLYPMTWQHIFIPVLPEHLIDYLSAPMPFLIGVPWYLMQKVYLEELGDAVILNADTDRVSTPFSDLKNLPEEVVSSLRKSLSPPSQLLGDGVARAFMQALVHLIGNYREAIEYREEEKRSAFDQEKFVAHRPPHFQPFVTKMLELQIFRQFVEERVNLFNSGLLTSDEFELEASVYDDRSSSKVKQMITNVKLSSGAFMKNVKSKTNPAMKSAVKSVTKKGLNVREKSRLTYKELRGKLKDIQHQSKDSTPYSNGLKPRSAPSSPTHATKRSFNPISGDFESGYSVRTTYKRVSQPCSVKSLENSSLKSRKQENNTSPTSSADSEKTPSPQNIDLVGELEDVLKTQLAFSTSSSLQESTNTVSVDNSEAGAALFPVDFQNYEEPLSKSDVCTVANGEDRLTLPASSKLLSASLASLPLLDLSLDIPLPPPLFAPLPAASSSSFPAPLAADRQRPSPIPSSLRHSFRSPKILPPETFGSLPSSLEGAVVRPIPTPPTSDPAPRAKAHTLPSEVERPAAAGISTTTPAPCHRPTPTFPKYDVSPFFSASLAKFSLKGDTGSYFYSQLSKTSSRSSDSVLDFETPVGDNNRSLIPPHTLPSPSLSPPPDIQYELSSPYDAMTMSLPPDIASLSHVSSSISHTQSPLPFLSPPPRSRRRRKKVTSPAQENGACQDLLLLSSPKDEEEFDPLFTKEIPPLPPRTSTQPRKPLSLTCDQEANILSINGPPIPELPAKLNPDRYRPFSSLQKTGITPTPLPPPGTVQNPLYNPHQPPILTQYCPSAPFPRHPANNPAAAFAASLLVGEQETEAYHKLPSNSPTFIGRSIGAGKPGKEFAPATMTDRDLLGDFCSDFKKLSVAAPSKTRVTSTQPFSSSAFPDT